MIAIDKVWPSNTQKERAMAVTGAKFEVGTREPAVDRKEVMRVLNISAPTYYRKVRSGEIPCFKLGSGANRHFMSEVLAAYGVEA